MYAEKSPLKSLRTLHETQSSPQQSTWHRQGEGCRTPPQRRRKIPRQDWPAEISSALPAVATASNFCPCTEGSWCCRSTSSAGIVSSSVTLPVVGAGLAGLKGRRQARTRVITGAVSHPALGSSLCYSFPPEVSAVVEPHQLFPHHFPVTALRPFPSMGFSAAQ